MIFFDTPISYFKFENLSKFSDRIVHFITTRNHLNDNNFSIGLNDFIPNNKVIDNRKALANQFNLELNNFVFANQIHSDKIALITDIHKGLGTINRETAVPHRCYDYRTNITVCLNQPIVFLFFLRSCEKRYSCSPRWMERDNCQNCRKCGKIFR